MTRNVGDTPAIAGLRRTRMRVFATLVLMLALVPAAQAAGVPADLVKAELLADVKTVQAGTPFTVGVMLKIKPDWHIYWIYPGDAGLPTRVKFNLPDGFKTGELKFPLPVRFDQPGGIVGYGYRDEVMLTATITPPADLP